MNIRIVDEEGLGTALMMDGFSVQEIDNAKQSIRNLFTKTTQMLFNDVLKKDRLDTIEVRMVQNTAVERHGKEAVRLASFNGEKSRENHLVFIVYEETVKMILEGKETDILKTTIVHEMIHGADLPMIKHSMAFLDGLSKKINAVHENIFEQLKMNTYQALFDFLNMLRHYRNEGVAILGERILTRSKFSTDYNELNAFNRIFELSLLWANAITKGQSISDDLKKQRHHLAYEIAPVILLLVLNVEKAIDYSLAPKVLKGLRTGEYDLSDEEISEIISQSLSLSLSSYIQGLLEANRYDCHVAPIVPFLEFCALLQKDYDEDNIKALEKLMEQPDMISNTFVESIEGIMGCLFSEEELNEHYRQFCQNPPSPKLYPKMMDKVSTLHEVNKADEDPDRRKIAQWALTYLYDDVDVIHDDIPVIGLVDDMIVLDSALRTLGITV